MADSFGKCTNFGLCSKADSREPVAAASGSLECPECGKMMQPSSAKGRASGGVFPVKKAGIAAAVLIVLLGLLWALLPADNGTPAPDPLPAPEPVPAPAPDPGPVPNPDPGPAPPPDPNPVSPDPIPSPVPAPPPAPGPVVNPVPLPAPVPAPAPDPAPESKVTYSGPSSGRIVWEGEIKEPEGIVTIEGNSADKGRIVSGGVPGGTPLVLSVQDLKNVGIAMTPQQGSGFRRLVLRVKKGKRRAVIDWAAAQ